MRNKAFTIIELLLTVSIMVIVIGAMLSGGVESKARSRDAMRIADIQKIQAGLDSFYSDCQTYPPSLTQPTLANPCKAVSLSKYITVPKPPSGTSQTSYDYSVLNSPVGYHSYVLRVILEKNSPVVKSGLDSFPTGNWTVSFTCDSDPDSLYYCLASW